MCPYPLSQVKAIFVLSALGVTNENKGEKSIVLVQTSRSSEREWEAIWNHNASGLRIAAVTLDGPQAKHEAYEYKQRAS